MYCYGAIYCRMAAVRKYVKNFEDIFCSLLPITLEKNTDAKLNQMFKLLV